MRIQFPQEQIVKRMASENSWWEEDTIGAPYAIMKRREYFKLFFPLVIEKQVKRAVVLMGPRRVGKTVLLFHTIEELIKEKKVPAKNICYFSIEAPTYNGIGLEELLNYFLETNHLSKTSSDVYVFFDEIQYLKDWEIHLKTLVDSYHSIKFIVSGSAAAALKLKSNESGAGRFTDFILPPLTFHEYLSLKGLESIIVERPNNSPFSLNYETDNIISLNKHFIDYINFGGYPEVSLSETIQANPERYIKSDIVDKVLLRDLPTLYGIDDITELNSLFTYIAFNTGSEMSLDSISQSSGVSANTIKKYITYLEAAFLIKVVHRVDENAKKFRRANFFKIYLTNPSLRCALFSPIKEDDKYAGNLVETAIFSQWQHTDSTELYYARWNKGEVDIVSLGSGNLKPIWTIEIKWSNKCVYDRSELKNIITFSRSHNVKQSKVTTYDIEKMENIDGIDISFVPSSLYCYTVGRNLVLNRQLRIENNPQ